MNKITDNLYNNDINTQLIRFNNILIDRENEEQKIKSDKYKDKARDHIERCYKVIASIQNIKNKKEFNIKDSYYWYAEIRKIKDAELNNKLHYYHYNY